MRTHLLLLGCLLAASSGPACRGTPARDASAEAGAAVPACAADGPAVPVDAPASREAATGPAPEPALDAPQSAAPPAPPVAAAGAVPQAAASRLPGAAPASLPPPLRELRAALDDARSAAPDADLSTGGTQPLEPLVGLTRDAVREALGAPGSCAGDVSVDSAGRGHPVAPCATHDDWFYSFYHLPEGSVGGGPELLLQFDAQGVCTRAAWRYTQ